MGEFNPSEMRSEEFLNQMVKVGVRTDNPEEKMEYLWFRVERVIDNDQFQGRLRMAPRWAKMTKGRQYLFRRNQIVDIADEWNE